MPVAIDAETAALISIVERLRSEYDRTKFPVIDWRMDKNAGNGVAEHLLKQTMGMFATAQRRVDDLAAPLVDLNSPELNELRNNVKWAFLARLGRSAEHLRHVQTEYTQRISAIESRRQSQLVQIRKFSSLESNDDEDTQRTLLVEDPPAVSLKERDKELTVVAESILQVVELLRSMQTLVIEQGSMMDRIDYNLERSSRYLCRAHGQLDKAQTRNVAQQSRKLILLFLVMLLILFMVAIGARASAR